ncbi:tautomerase family protein [Catenulispora rubra]|uniref:tautomerase family protein n=1 Tax=Catenulispora rubra TaxID=280293 RepID=UPI001E381D10|nr:4-oxalocrotonate tautomerase family protein [Catenulispora rubra]
MPFANFKVPAGTLDAEQKEKIVHRATELYVEIYGERARGGTMVLVEEVADGGWGIGDHVLTLAALQQGGDSAPAQEPAPASASATDPDTPDLAA